jgi:protoporphyrinogen oxidase
VNSVERHGAGLRIRSGAGEHWFDQAVVTTPSPLAARLCPQLGAEERSHLSRQPHIGVVCASLLLKRPLAGAYLTYIADRSNPLTAVIEMTALLDPGQLGGAHLVYLPRYAERSSRWFSMADREVRAELMGGLRRIHPDLCEDQIIAFKVARAPFVLPVPMPGSAREPVPFSTSVPGLAIANAAQIIDGTLNANETVMLANRAAASLLEDAQDPVREAAA